MKQEKTLSRELIELGPRIKAKAIEMGFYAANLPESVGGGGLDYTTLDLTGHIARSQLRPYEH